MCRRVLTGFKVQRVFAFALLALGLALLSAGPVQAAASPPGCTSNNMTIDITVLTNSVVNGGTAQFTVDLHNDSGVATACDIENADAFFRCPDATGNPTGPDIPLTTNHNFPADGTGDLFGIAVSCGPTTYNVGVISAAGLAVIGDPDGVFPFDATFGVVKFATDQGFSLSKPAPFEVQIEFCGDGIVQPGEQCDDGNTNNLDGCRNDCTLPPTAIPTLSEWAQLGLALILMAGGGWHLRRRRTLRTD